jgi:O-acetyl-ADP-ribose deacetylase (regulator of RNase III)
MKMSKNMIRFYNGDILQADAEALVNTVNCVGVMGRGIALQFKNAYPKNFKEYKKACDHGEVEPGKMLVHETGTFTSPKYIINFPTKRHWKGKSKIEDIDSGLNALVEVINNYKINSIAIPPLGSGLGGLSWNTVRKLIEEKLSVLENVDIHIYEPTDAKPFTKSTDVPSMTAGRAAMIKLMEKYLAGLMDPFVTVLEIQKLMYFMQESGQELKLSFEKGKYGPYAPNLRHVLKKMDGHLIDGYGDSGDDPNKPLSLLPGAIKDANKFLESQDSVTLSNLEKVFTLVNGFETGFGLELLATVHWVLKHEEVRNDNELVTKVWSWNAGKQKFTSTQIVLASKTLLANNLVHL